jgi:hypothetical protein
MNNAGFEKKVNDNIMLDVFIIYIIKYLFIAMTESPNLVLTSKLTP